MHPSSARLLFRRLEPGDAPRFHALATDPYVRRFLLDGHVVPLQWCVAEIGASDALFDRIGLGLWWVAARDAPEAAIGFAGFRVFPEVTGEAELIVALLESAAGQGLGTEIARALTAHAHGLGHVLVHSAADAPNAASHKMLERAGFTRTGTVPGEFGEIVLYEHR